MPRISRADALERKMIDMLEAKAFDTTLPAYAQIKAAGTLASLMRRRDKRQATKAAAAAARRAERDAATPVRRYAVPDNGRSPEPNGYLDDA
jgi:hypothetical protein